MGLEFESQLGHNPIIKESEAIAMNTTKDAILEIIKTHPGLRGREIAEHLQVHHLDIIHLLDELRIEEKIQVMYHYDLANMKYYSRYYLNI